MTIIDRYLLFLFVKIFGVCFTSFTGLYIVIHLFSNLDELTIISHSQGWPRLMWEFYGPRIAELFDKTAAVWTLVSAVFAISLMQRRREMAAIEAAGITRTRLLRSIFLCALIIIGVAIVNREWLLPQVRDRLVRTPQDWQNTQEISLGTFQDMETGIKVRGAALSLIDHKIVEPELQLPASIAGLETGSISRIQASAALISPASTQHAAGLLLNDVKFPADISELRSLTRDNQTMIYWPADTEWLEEKQCFVVCQFDPYQAAYGRKLLNYQSVPELLAELKRPRHWFGNGSSQIQLHSRLLQPLLDGTLILLGLPLMIRRTDKNIFVSAGICFFLVGAVQLTLIGSHSMGAYSLIKPAALAAWLPAILFTPLAIVAVRRIDV